MISKLLCSEFHNFGHPTKNFSAYPSDKHQGYLWLSQNNEFRSISFQRLKFLGSDALARCERKIASSGASHRDRMH